MSGNATDSGMVSLNAVASIGSNFSIRLCPTDSPEQTDCHFPLTFILTDTFSVFYIFLNNAVIYSLLLPEIQSQALFLP